MLRRAKRQLFPLAISKSRGRILSPAAPKLSKKSWKLKRFGSSLELLIVPGGVYGRHGRIFAAENFFFQSKKWQGRQWRGACFPGYQLVKNLFDKLRAAEGFSPPRL